MQNNLEIRHSLTQILSTMLRKLKISKRVWTNSNKMMLDLSNAMKRERQLRRDIYQKKTGYKSSIHQNPLKFWTDTSPNEPTLKGAQINPYSRDKRNSHKNSTPKRFQSVRLTSASTIHLLWPRWRATFLPCEIELGATGSTIGHPWIISKRGQNRTSGGQNL